MNAAMLLIALQLPAQTERAPLIRPIPQVQPRPPATDPILIWNEALLEAIRRDSTPPPKASRHLAMMHAAMFDAVSSLRRSYSHYLCLGFAPPGTSAECAAAVAAHRVLHALYPDQAERFDALLDTAMQGYPDGAGKEDAVELGRLVAEKLLKWRSTDGSDRTVRYTPRTGEGEWQPTLPAFKPGLLPQWGRVTPFTVRSLEPFRPSRPPERDSPEYLAHYREVKELGGVDSRTRTPEQTEIALFWADGAGTVTPPGHWNRIAQTVARQQGLGLEENARLFALLNLAMADAAISCWECKYRYSVWRPIQAVGVENPSWRPLIDTPPFPSYTSGHSSFSGAAAGVLACFFNTDRVRFATTSEGLPNVTRSFNGFWAAAEEAGRSRIYGGIHYQFDNAPGLASGRTIGEHACRTLLRPQR